MQDLPGKLAAKIEKRKTDNALRSLGGCDGSVDFFSNDYLGFGKSETIFKRAPQILKAHNFETNGATGSRLLSGNHPLYETAEKQIAAFHNVERALIFNSGYAANIGLLSSVPQRGDLVFYDELCHASIRDGIQMGRARAYKFRHNDVGDLTKKCNMLRRLERTAGSSGPNGTTAVYVVTESVFSMDGDAPNLKHLASFCTENGYRLIVDGAHAVGVVGDRGEGLVQKSALEGTVFARVVTFGKALGCHGAAVLGSTALCEYLFNFGRSFIYTTGLPPHAIATVIAAYGQLAGAASTIGLLHNNISKLRYEIERNGLKDRFPKSGSAIHACLVPTNDRVKKVALQLQREGYGVKPVLSPTVPMGQERLRICVHSFNSGNEIERLCKLLCGFI